MVWAHCGMELTGVRRPLISMKIITKKNITKMVWIMFCVILAAITPKPDIVTMNSSAPR